MKTQTLAMWFAAGALFWGALVVGVTCALEAKASGEEDAVVFDTEREATYWAALQQCGEDLDVARRELKGEKEKVRTTTVTVTLSCPVIPPCPACPACSSSSCLIEGLVGAGLGVLAGGGVCALSAGGPDVVVVP